MFVYHDSRSVLCHDGTYLCGDCNDHDPDSSLHLWWDFVRILNNHPWRSHFEPSTLTLEMQ